MKTRLEVNPGNTTPFLVLDLETGGAYATLFIRDLTPEDLDRVADEYRAALRKCDESEEPEPEPMSRCERAEEARWEEADRARSEIENR